jgi:hypothetical protein
MGDCKTVQSIKVDGSSLEIVSEVFEVESILWSSIPNSITVLGPKRDENFL